MPRPSPLPPAVRARPLRCCCRPGFRSCCARSGRVPVRIAEWGTPGVSVRCDRVRVEHPTPVRENDCVRSFDARLDRRRGPRLRVVALIGILVAAVFAFGAPACDSITGVCSEIGCDSGRMVRLDALPEGACSVDVSPRSPTAARPALRVASPERSAVPSGVQDGRDDRCDPVRVAGGGVGTEWRSGPAPSAHRGSCVRDDRLPTEVGRPRRAPSDPPRG